MAYEEGVEVRLRKAAAGLVQSVKSGELIGWLSGVLPFAKQGEH